MKLTISLYATTFSYSSSPITHLNLMCSGRLSLSFSNFVMSSTTFPLLLVPSSSSAIRKVLPMMSSMTSGEMMAGFEGLPSAFNLLCMIESLHGMSAWSVGTCPPCSSLSLAVSSVLSKTGLGDGSLVDASPLGSNPFGFARWLASSSSAILISERCRTMPVSSLYTLKHMLLPMLSEKPANRHIISEELDGNVLFTSAM